MDTLKGSQRKYLRGLAHNLKPVVFIGRKGDSDSVIQAADAALDAHELIKVKFVEFKDNVTKKKIIKSLEQRAFCQTVGIIGHTAILYRQHPDPEKRRIHLSELQRG